MANGEYGIDQRTWESLPVERQLWLIFSEFNAQRNECNEHFCRLEKELASKASKDEHTELATKFDRRKRVDTTFSAMMGFIGGLVGFLTSKIMR